MAKKLYEETDIQAIANSIRGKCGTTCGYKVCDMAAAIDTITTGGGGGGGNDYDTKILEKRLSGAYENTTVTKIADYMLSGNTGLTSASLPNVTTIGKSAFEGNTWMTTCSIPKVTGTIGEYTFYNCKALQSMNVNTVTSIGGHAFEGCEALTTFVGNSVTILNERAFYNCKALNSVSLLALTKIYAGVFRYCTALTELVLPELITISGRSQFLFGCTSLAKLDLGKLSSCTNDEFRDLPALSTVIFRNTESVVAMTQGVYYNNNTFAGTPIASGTGYIYVPSALVEAYKADASFSNYAAQIRAIEDYPEICG